MDSFRAAFKEAQRNSQGGHNFRRVEERNFNSEKSSTPCTPSRENFSQKSYIKPASTPKYPNIDKSLLKNFKTGDIVYALLDGVGCEQEGIRPVLIVQNNVGNFYSPTLIIAPITSQNKNNLPTHFYIENYIEVGLDELSLVSFEQVRVIDKCRLYSTAPIGHIAPEQWQQHLIAAFGVRL